MADETHDPLDGLFGGDADPAADKAQEAPVADAAKPAEVTQEQQEAPAEGAEQEPASSGRVKMVPLAALEESRARAKSAEERLAARDVGKPEKTDAEEVVTRMRDPKDDPQGAYEDLAGNFQMAIVNTTLNFSERLARTEHGKELVDDVKAWALKKFEIDPAYASKILLDPDPYSAAIEDYKKSQRADKATDLPDDVLEGLDEEELALLRKHREGKKPPEAAAMTAQPRADDGKFQAQPPARKSAAIPPKSIAGDTSAGGKPSAGKVPIGEGSAFSGAFG